MRKETPRASFLHLSSSADHCFWSVAPRRDEAPWEGDYSSRLGAWARPAGPKRPKLKNLHLAPSWHRHRPGRRDLRRRLHPGSWGRDARDAEAPLTRQLPSQRAHLASYHLASSGMASMRSTHAFTSWCRTVVWGWRLGPRLIAIGSNLQVGGACCLQSGWHT